MLVPHHVLAQNIAEIGVFFRKKRYLFFRRLFSPRVRGGSPVKEPGRAVIVGGVGLDLFKALGLFGVGKHFKDGRIIEVVDKGFAAVRSRAVGELFPDLAVLSAGCPTCGSLRFFGLFRLPAGLRQLLLRHRGMLSRIGHLHEFLQNIMEVVLVIRPGSRPGSGFGPDLGRGLRMSFGSGLGRGLRFGFRLGFGSGSRSRFRFGLSLSSRFGFCLRFGFRFGAEPERRFDFLRGLCFLPVCGRGRQIFFRPVILFRYFFFREAAFHRHQAVIPQDVADRPGCGLFLKIIFLLFLLQDFPALFRRSLLQVLLHGFVFRLGILTPEF